MNLWETIGQKRLTGTAMSGAFFEDGTLVFAGCWSDSPAGAYIELFRFEPKGERCLIVDHPGGERIALQLHRFDRICRTNILWRTSVEETEITWEEENEPHRLRVRHPDHPLFRVVSNLLRLLPEHWLTTPAFARLGASLLGPLLGIGSKPFLGRTETGVPVQLLMRELRTVRTANYWRGDHSAGHLQPYHGGIDLGELSFTRWPVLAHGAILFQLPPASSTASAPELGASQSSTPM